MDVSFKPKRRPAASRIPRNVLVSIAQPIILPVSGCIDEARKAAAAGASKVDNPLAKMAVGAACGIAGGMLGAVAGLAFGLAVPIRSALKGAANLFGREIPDKTLVAKEVYNAILNEDRKELGRGLFLFKEGQELSDEAKGKLAVALQKGDVMKNVAEALGANEDNMDAAKTFIKTQLGISDDHFRQAAKDEYERMKTKSSTI